MTEEEKTKIIKRAETDITSHMQLAKEVSDDVKKRGDAALLAYTEKFDRVKLPGGRIKVTEEEIQQGYDSVEPKVREAIEYAAKNIRDFHAKQLPEEMWFTEVDKGLLVGEKTCLLYTSRCV